MAGFRSKDLASGSLSIAIVLGFGFSEEAQAKRPFICEAVPRYNTIVNVATGTPEAGTNPTTTGKLCFYDGASFSVGAAFFQLRGIRSVRLPPACPGRGRQRASECLAAKLSTEALLSLMEKGALCNASKAARSQWYADCQADTVLQVAGELVARGFACATKDGPEYVALEKEARAAKRGLWSDVKFKSLKSFPPSQCILGAVVGEAR